MSIDLYDLEKCMVAKLSKLTGQEERRQFAKMDQDLRRARTLNESLARSSENAALLKQELEKIVEAWQ